MTAVRFSMMAIFRHIRSVRIHQKMATSARWGRLEFCEEPTLVEVTIMRKILTTLVAAMAIATAAVATSGTAQAQWHGGWHGGWGWGPGPFIGGLAAGALIGGALAAPYYYPYPYGYYAGHYAPPPYGGPCVWRRVWNGYAWVRTCV
jgi:hypothetical protein